MPTATLTVSGLSGGVTTASAPTITPGGSPDAGSQLLQWEAELYSDATRAILASGSGTLFRPWDHGVALAPGVNYTVRVRVQDVSWAWSPWHTVTFRVAPTTPPPPVISALPGKHPTTGAPRAELSILWPQGYDYSQRILVDIQREDEVYGWIPFAQRMMTPGQPLMGVDDYGAPQDVPVRYRVRASIWDKAGQPVVGGWTTMDTPFTLRAKRSSGWIVDPNHPELSVRVVMVDREDRTHDVAASGTDMLSPTPATLWGGRSHNFARMAQRVSTGLPSLPTGRITARCDTREQFERALRVLSTGSLLLFRGHRELDYRGFVQTERDLWFRVSDKVVEKDIVKYGHVARFIEWSWIGQHPQGVMGQ